MVQKCLVSVSEQKEISNFDLGHPVYSLVHLWFKEGKRILALPNWGKKCICVDCRVPLEFLEQ